MLELITVILIVAAAAYFTIRKLVRKASDGGCGDCGCSCGSDKSKFTEIAKIGSEKVRKL